MHTVAANVPDAFQRRTDPMPDALPGGVACDYCNRAAHMRLTLRHVSGTIVDRSLCESHIESDVGTSWTIADRPYIYNQEG